MVLIYFNQLSLSQSLESLEHTSETAHATRRAEPKQILYAQCLIVHAHAESIISVTIYIPNVQTHTTHTDPGSFLLCIFGPCISPFCPSSPSRILQYWLSATHNGRALVRSEIYRRMRACLCACAPESGRAQPPNFKDRNQGRQRLRQRIVHASRTYKLWSYSNNVCAAAHYKHAHHARTQITHTHARLRHLVSACVMKMPHHTKAYD